MITSAKTALNQVPALHKWMQKQGLLGDGLILVDYGGGPYDTATEFLAGFGVTNLVYDPYNRPYSHNQTVAVKAVNSPIGAVLLSNVLNVVQDPEERVRILWIAAWFASAAQFEPAPVLITVYEGDRSGIGKVTPKGWQEHRKRSSYREEVMASGAFEWAKWTKGAGVKVLICSPKQGGR